MFAIAYTSVMAAWKRREEDRGTLDMLELDRHATTIGHDYLSVSSSELLIYDFRHGVHDEAPARHGASLAPIPIFSLQVSTLYQLATHAYLASVLSVSPRAYWVLHHVNALVRELKKHIEWTSGKMSAQERKLLKFPLFIAATMAGHELEADVDECSRILSVEPCGEAMAEVRTHKYGVYEHIINPWGCFLIFQIQGYASILRCLRSNLWRAGVVVPPTWKDAIFMTRRSTPDDVPPVMGVLWI